MAQARYKKRILDLSKKLDSSHIGSCISMLPLLEDIYKKKLPNDKVILDNAHSHLAHLVVREWKDEDIIKAIKEYSIHCDYRICDATGGSLGHGIGIGLGMAIANPMDKVYVTVSDGSIQEGSNWEAMRISQDLKIKNLAIYANFNGFSAVSNIDVPALIAKLTMYHPDIKFYRTYNSLGYHSLEGHYKKVV